MEMCFIDLLEQHKFRILRFCSIYTNNTEDREDLFQEIIFNVWKSLPSFKGQSDITTWLYKVALRVSMRFAQKSAKTRDLRCPLQGVHLTHEDPARELEKQEEIRQLRACISTLNEIDRLLITLYLEDLAHKKIAEIIGITENYVAVKLKRIKTKLFACLKETP